MTPIPPVVTDILARQQLQVERVIRDGPRYWVGRVTRETGEPFILKAVLQDDPWLSPGGREFRPSDQLRAEIMTIRYLGSQLDALSGHVPIVHAHSDTSPVWSLRQIINGPDMAAGPGPFVYSAAFYQTIRPQELVDYIFSYQRLTHGALELLADTPRSEQANLTARMIAAGLHQPQGGLEPYAQSVRDYLESHLVRHDQLERVMTHGEMYPPHIFYENQQVCVIDWENASLGSPYHDLVAVWLRTYDNPRWQAEFVREIAQRLGLASPGWQADWEIEAVYQMAGALNYLHWSHAETPAEKAAATHWLQGQLGAILGAGK